MTAERPNFDDFQAAIRTHLQAWRSDNKGGGRNLNDSLQEAGERYDLRLVVAHNVLDPTRAGFCIHSQEGLVLFVPRLESEPGFEIRGAHTISGCLDIFYNGNPFAYLQKQHVSDIQLVNPDN